jgi:hypothetical protein
MPKIRSSQAEDGEANDLIAAQQRSALTLLSVANEGKPNKRPAVAILNPAPNDIT